MATEDANAYGYENVGLESINTQQGNAYGYENVGLESINTKQGNAYGYENVGAEAVVIPSPTPTEYWGVVGSGAGSQVLILDSRLDGNAYGYENVTV